MWDIPVFSGWYVKEESVKKTVRVVGCGDLPLVQISSKTWGERGLHDYIVFSGFPKVKYLIFLFFYFLKLLNEFYYIYSCTVIITTQFYSISITMGTFDF